MISFSHVSNLYEHAKGENSMTCKDVQKHLLVYIDSQVKPDLHAGIEAHLMQCPTCRALHQQTTALFADDAIWVPEHHAPRANWPSMLKAITQSEATQTSRRRPASPFRWKPVAATVFCLALGFFTGLLLTGDPLNAGMERDSIVAMEDMQAANPEDVLLSSTSTLTTESLYFQYAALEPQP